MLRRILLLLLVIVRGGLSRVLLLELGLLAANHAALLAASDCLVVSVQGWGRVLLNLNEITVGGTTSRDAFLQVMVDRSLGCHSRPCSTTLRVHFSLVVLHLVRLEVNQGGRPEDHHLACSVHRCRVCE